ncbi:MAG: cation-translocating P-type ATPase [Simplicispira suum]|uniref:heavy metal translocating P-type ATPase n=1 Tax=Simplicispira suum TaxID=2109915 RepID=UPI001C6C5FB5|nr:cation-translocating P-type ATPase [Simplicispira suum]MBW7831684.1 cation-translocating P-type ATPase [Simplicispira suum]
MSTNVPGPVPGGLAAPTQDASVVPSASGDALLDDPAEWPAFGRKVDAQASGECWESHVVIEGMHCAACALTIEDALRSVPGVEQADVSAASQRARVVWSATAAPPSLWFAAVRRAGYRALPAADAQARQQRVQEHRRALWRWLVAGFCMMQVMMYAWPAYIAQPGDLSGEMEALLRWASWVITLPVVLFACGPFFTSALADIRHRRISMDLPVALGMAITFVISSLGTFDPDGIFGREVYFDSLTMFVFFLLTGRWLELRLRDRTAGALEAVMNRLPDSVERRDGDGHFVRVAVRRLAVDDVVRVLPGEAFPSDGCLISGSTRVDEALLTGESSPRWRTVGASVSAGSMNLESAVQMKVERLGAGTRFGEIVALMESASLQKPRLAQLADRVARPFLVFVLLAALGAMLWWWPRDPQHALMVAVSVLIVTCPCALSLATPVAMLSAAGALARGGVLVRNLQALETLAGIDSVVFDKTGTLTHDRMALRHMETSSDWTQAEALGLAAVVARYSLHPASRALVAAAEQAEPHGNGVWEVVEVTETPGRGLSAQMRLRDGSQTIRTLLLGSAEHVGAPWFERDGLQVCMALDGGAVADRSWARFDLEEQLRSDLHTSLRALAQAGIGVQILSGDYAGSVTRVAQRAGIDAWRGGCTPADKLAAIRALQARGHRVAMVGDGLNDGPVLAAANASFAFGSAVPLTSLRSDFVVLGGQLPLIAQSVLLARRTLRIVRQNLLWAAGYNVVSVPLAIAGLMPAWLAGLGMAASSLLVVLNSARLARAMPSLVPAADGAEKPVPMTHTQVHA